MKKKKKFFFVFATSFLSKENQLIANSLIYSLSLSLLAVFLSLLAVSCSSAVRKINQFEEKNGGGVGYKELFLELI